jgi:hypothetical protein
VHLHKSLTFCIFILFALTAHAIDLTDPSELRKLLLEQPDFVATPEFDAEGVNSWVKRVMKRGEMFRFEIVEEEKGGTSSEMTVLAYPGKKISAFLPKEKTWWYLEEDNLSQAAFSTLVGVDSYYLTKVIMNKQTDIDFVSEEEYEGHKCLKIRVSNHELLDPELGLEAMWLAHGPLYFFAAQDLKNLIIRVVAHNEEGDEQDFYLLRDISLRSEDIPKVLFEIPSGFRQAK